MKLYQGWLHSSRGYPLFQIITRDIWDRNWVAAVGACAKEGIERLSRSRHPAQPLIQTSPVKRPCTCVSQTQTSEPDIDTSARMYQHPVVQTRSPSTEKTGGKEGETHNGGCHRQCREWRHPGGTCSKWHTRRQSRPAEQSAVMAAVAAESSRGSPAATRVGPIGTALVQDNTVLSYNRAW